MAFYNNGESNNRPGVHRRITNRSDDLFKSAPKDPGPGSTKYMLLKDSKGVLLKTSDGYYLAVRN